MKIVKTISFLILTFWLSQNSSAQNKQVFEHANMIINTAKKYHYNPREVNDVFAKLVFYNMLDLLDYNGVFFSEEDIQSLNNPNQIINDIVGGKDAFFTNISKLYKSKLQKTDSIILTFQNVTIDFNKDDTLFFQKGNKRVSEKDLIKKWKKGIKLKTLLLCLPKNDSLISEKQFSKENLEKNKSELIKSISCRINSKYKNIEELEHFLESSYLNSIATAFDPHTLYFTEEEKKEFETRLSKDAVSFGFSVSLNEKDQIEIEHIVPGSSAWKSNKINEGDIILSVKLPNIEEKRFDCMSIKSINSFLSSSEVLSATFNILKKDGQKIKVTLIKREISNEDNSVNSFLLEGDSKVGYINLPSFYTGFDSNDVSKACSSDIAKEIIKLKRNGIKGLILDLRNNGGGSMFEAIKMIGLFINYGAVGIVRSRDTKPVTLKDMDRGVVFEAPLVVMVNQFSASASELFASAMQDYNRAVIVGTKTFGKSSVQTILPIEAYKNDKLNSLESKEGAYLKITTGMFYRITGKSHQNKGVFPDVEFYEDTISISEKDFLSSLKNTSINKKTYFFPLDTLPINKLKKESKNRTKIHNKDFNIYEGSDIFIPLNISSFVKFYNKSLNKNTFVEKDILFKVNNVDFIKGFSGLTEIENEINEDIMKQIKNDNEIIETYLILNDLIKLKN